MTFQFRSMLSIEADIRYRANATGLIARHDSVTVRTLFNVSWQELRELVAIHSDGAFLVGTASANLPTTAVAGDDYVEVDWPVDAVAVYGVAVKFTNENRFKPLRRIPFGALHDYNDAGLLASLPVTGRPVAYCTREIQKGGAAAVETPGKVMIVPIPTGGVYRLWYLQAWAPLTADTDSFSGHAAFIEHAVWNTIIKMMASDKDSQFAYSVANAERQRAEERIIARAKTLESGTAMSPRDARDDGFFTDLYNTEL